MVLFKKHKKWVPETMKAFAVCVILYKTALFFFNTTAKLQPQKKSKRIKKSPVLEKWLSLLD